MNKQKTIASNPIYQELTISTLKELLSVLDSSDKSNNKAIILKFGAPWCRPCQQINNICHQYFAQMSEDIICFDINIDNNMELYVAYKAKKMVTSIPTILVYINNVNRDTIHWYVPDKSITGSNPTLVGEFLSSIRKL